MKMILPLLLTTSIMVHAAVTAFTITGTLPYRGQSLSGAEFGAANIPGVHGTHYYYPAVEEAEYFMQKGMNTFRLPFLWERLQPTIGAAFNADELARIHTFVDAVTADGAFVILDPHNYGRRDEKSASPKLIGIDITNAEFADLWTRLSKEFKGNSKVIFGLMNEPYPTAQGAPATATLTTEMWRSAAQAAITAIRADGAKNLILVSGNYWSGAHSWTTASYGGTAGTPVANTTNAATMINITDPENNFAFEVHQYFNTDYSGAQPTCTANAKVLDTFTKWLRDNGKKAFLGELAGGANTQCETVIDEALDSLEKNADVWIGYAWWASGPWWGWFGGTGDYSLDPINGFPSTQLSWLVPHLTYRSDGTVVKVVEDPSGVGTNILTNGDFSSGNTNGWDLVVTSPAAGAMSVVNGGLKVDITAVQDPNSNIQLQQTGVKLIAGHVYTFGYEVVTNQDFWPYIEVGTNAKAVSWTKTSTKYQFVFTAKATETATIKLSIGNMVSSMTFDNIKLVDNDAPVSILKPVTSPATPYSISKQGNSLLVASGNGVLLGATLFDAKGSVVGYLDHARGSIDMSRLSKGIYSLKMYGSAGTRSVQVRQ